jgi:uncharacterized membrane protein YczE
VWAAALTRTVEDVRTTWRDRLGVPREAPGFWPRVAWLYLGLVGFGVSLALLLRARLGLDPWDVLTQGIAKHVHLQFGYIVDIIGAIVLLAWIPLRQRPGVGTVSNVVVVGLVVNWTLDVLPTANRLVIRSALLVAAVGLNALATGCYIGAGLGPGPRDGLTTGLAARGHSIRVVRSVIELTVLVIGFALGGSVGVGTVVYAAGIGPLVHQTIPRLDLAAWSRRRAAARSGRPDPNPGRDNSVISS